MMTREELARAVLEVFRLQRAYFRLRPDDPDKRTALEASKAAEKELKYECMRIIDGPTLFDHDEPPPP